MEKEIAQKCRTAITGMMRLSNMQFNTNSEENLGPTIEAFSSWLRAHENTQVMLGSLLVVFGLWWIVRCILSMIINLLCPFFVAAIAVIFIPQLRKPLLGQNYPVLANVLRSSLLMLADKLKTV